MNIVYQDKILFIDLSGDIDINTLKSRIFSITSMYKIKDVVLYATDVFNYKKSIFNELKNDYSRVYGGNITIKR